MKKLSLGLLLLVGAAQSQALVWGFSAPIIDGSQEVPPTPSNAYGSGSFTLDDQTWTLTGSMTVTGLPLTSVTGAHIHIAPPGVNGPVVFDLVSNSISGFPQQSGNITIYAWTGTLQDHGTIGPRATILARLIANEGYINVHSQTFPGGEIRGHIECNGVVPEPATIAALSMGALALIRRRKR